MRLTGQSSSRHGTVLGFSIGDRLVATAAALPYGDDFGWISMVLVTAEWRRQGLATRLVAACTSLLRDAGRAALLDASPAATAIYAALGFVPLGTMERWEGHGGGERGCDRFREPGARPIGVWGRPMLLARGFPVASTQSRLPLSARLRDLAPGLLSLPSRPHRCRIAEAHALATEAIRAASGRVVVDVLDAGSVLIPTLIARGFRLQRPFTRMALGLAALPGDPAQMMAAAGPEFG